MKRPSFFNLMSHRLHCNATLSKRERHTSIFSRRKEGNNRNIVEGATAAQPYFYYFCWTHEKILISVQLKQDYYANPIRSPEILLKIRTG